MDVVWDSYDCPKCGLRHLVPVDTITFICGKCKSQIDLVDDVDDAGGEDEGEAPPDSKDDGGNDL